MVLHIIPGFFGPLCILKTCLTVVCYCDVYHIHIKCVTSFLQRLYAGINLLWLYA